MGSLVLALFCKDPVLATARDRVLGWIWTFRLPSTASLCPYRAQCNALQGCALSAERFHVLF